MNLIDSSLWIDYSRTKSPPALKQFIAPHVLRGEACVCEPVIFEMLRCASRSEAFVLNNHFDLLPTLPTPPDLWIRGVTLSERCRKQNLTIGGFDLLIAVIALENDAVVVTFDADFESVSQVCGLKVQKLIRPPTIG